MKRILQMVSAGATLVAAQCASGATGLNGDTRELRREGLTRPARAQAHNVAKAAALVRPRAHADVSLGLAYTRGADVTAWNTPASVLFSFPERPWRLAISTLGYEHDAFPGASAAGWTDVKFKLSHVFTSDMLQFIPGVAVRAPAHGEVGSKHWQQELSLAIKATVSGWSIGLGSALKHNSGTSGPAAKPRYGSLSIGHELGSECYLTFLVDRLIVPRKAGISTATLALDFPIALGGGDAFDASLALTKGISTDHSTSIEFGISRRF